MGRFTELCVSLMRAGESEPVGLAADARERLSRALISSKPEELTEAVADLVAFAHYVESNCESPGAASRILAIARAVVEARQQAYVGRAILAPRIGRSLPRTRRGLSLLDLRLGR